MDTLSILIEGKEHILNVVNTGKSLMVAMNDQVRLCPEYGKTIVSKKVLGRGTQGMAMLVEIDGKEYVAKKTEVEVPVRVKSAVSKTPEEAYRKIADILGVSVETVKKYNPEDDLENIVIPRPAFDRQLCDTGSEPRSYKRFDGRGFTIVPPHSYLCYEESFSEYVIGLYASDLAERGYKNFVKVFGFSSCPEGSFGYEEENFMVTDHYVIMERIDTDLIKVLNEIYNEEDITSIVFQLIFAIATYQKEYKISHNDLKTDNIFLERRKNPGKMACYRIDGDLYCLPGGKYTVKIGDFGLSVKWDKPIVGNETVFITGYDQGDGDGAWVPDWYSPVYDLFYSLTRIQSFVDGGNEFLNHALHAIIKDTDYTVGKLIVESNAHPNLKRLSSIKDKTAEYLLRSPLVDRFRAPPDFDEKFELLGEIYDEST